jgi:2-desacetyl-2-hydroxyethyl bacteriochlorophyllide A dehydrogenase
MLRGEYVAGAGLEINDGPDEQPGPHEVALEISHVGICGTDLHLLQGAMDHRTGERQVIGHEASGVVVARGTHVDIPLGTHAAVIPVRQCGTCPACLTGNGHVCQELVFLGIDAPGALRRTMIVDASLLVPIDPAVPHVYGALVEPTAVAVHDVRRAGVAEGDVVVVVGGGPIGALIAVVARHQGAEVLVVELDPYRQRTVRELGFEVLDVQSDVEGEVSRRTGGAGADVAFEVSGAEAGVATAIEVLKVRGVLGLVAVHPEPRAVNLHRFFWRELTLHGARLYDRSDFERAAALLAAGAVPAESLISRVFPLEQAVEAADVLVAKADVMKVLVDCHG